MRNTNLDLTSAPFFFHDFFHRLLLAPRLLSLSLQQMAVVRGGQVTDDLASPPGHLSPTLAAPLLPSQSPLPDSPTSFPPLFPILLRTALLLWAGGPAPAQSPPSGARLLDRADGKRRPGGDVL